FAAQHGPDTGIQQGPWRMLARGPAAEVAPGDQDAAAFGSGLVQHEIRIDTAVVAIAPVVEGVPPQALSHGGGEEARRDDAVGVDVGVGQHHGARGQLPDGLHAATSAGNAVGSATWPATAEAAAVAGLASTVRTPLPCRPSKLRLDVDTTRSPGRPMSPFMAMHMEQPGWRHSAPASRNTSCMPSASASRRTRSE